METSRWLLEHLLQAEFTDRPMRSVSHQMHTAKFPAHRDLAGFDFAVSHRYLHSTAVAKKRIKTREQACKSDKTAPPDDESIQAATTRERPLRATPCTASRARVDDAEEDNREGKNLHLINRRT